MDPINPLTLFFAAIFTNNILLTNFLGLCPFLSMSGRKKSALGMGAAVVFVMASTTALNNLVHYKVLVPLGLEHFRFIVFIVVIAAFVQLVEMTVERFFPALYFSLGIFLPLITVNCAIFGASLFMVIRKYDFVQSLAYGVGSGIGWMLAIIAISSIREKLQKTAKLPKGLEGPAITLIITGLLALAFLAFSGMIRVQ
ncbi:MAG: NADH:ubiquinone reductase (Na(+)-transporting) subunit E [Candidatus Aminicenantes bacterium]|nr:MAG: NADH:ubiquinone reductase (Na(+)-transporting) subunit E [Candidatus Aminicenantes bacterium]